ncbi:hypothetical protein L7F22_034113 [Adiantum nelumboides]|nr:hypothetical protein [Adiantum nelumboides]
MGKEMSKLDDKIKEHKKSSDTALNTIIHRISKLEKESETYNKEKEAWEKEERWETEKEQEKEEWRKQQEEWGKEREDMREQIELLKASIASLTPEEGEMHTDTKEALKEELTKALTASIEDKLEATKNGWVEVVKKNIKKEAREEAQKEEILMNEDEAILQKAIAYEAEHGFPNTAGRTKRFSEFLASKLFTLSYANSSQSNKELNLLFNMAQSYEIMDVGKRVVMLNKVVALLGFKSVQDLSDHHHAVNEASKDLDTGSLERNYRLNANQLLQKISHPAIVFGSSERIELFNFSDRQTGTDGKQPLPTCDVAGVDDADITVQPHSVVGVTKRKGSLPMGSERGASGQVRKAKKAAKKVMASDRYEDWMLNKPISLMEGLSPTMCSQLEDNGFYTLRKLLQHYPRNYLNFLQAGQTIEDGQFLNFSGKIVSSRSHNKKGLGILEILIANEGHQVERGNENKEKNPVTLHVTKFFSGARYSSKWFLDKMVEKYPVGAYAAVSGKVKTLQYTNHYEVKEYSLELVKDIENTDKAPSLYPIYPAKGRLDAKFFKLCIQKVLPNLPLNIDPFPEPYKVARNLMDLREAYNGIHSPDTEAVVEKARQRFVFDEFLYLQVLVAPFCFFRNTAVLMWGLAGNHISRDFVFSRGFQEDSIDVFQKFSILQCLQVILKRHLCFEKQVGLPTI